MIYDKLIEPNFFLFQNDKIKNNTYAIDLDDTLVIIDPSWNASRVIELFKNKTFKNIIVFMTHGHYDHLGDISLIFSFWKNAIIYINKNEKDILLSNLSENDWPFQTKLSNFVSNIKYYDFSKKVKINEIEFNFIEVPGHSSGSTIIVYKNYYFTGDFIFLHEIGRLDLILSSEQQMIDSIKKISKLLCDENMIMAGHRDIGNFKELKKSNEEYIEYLNK